MRHVVSRVVCLVGLAVALCQSLPQAAACTGVKLKAKDGSLVYGRTLEFGMDLQSNPIVIPRQFPLQGTAVEGMPGLSWSGKYAAVGLNAFGLDIILDGVNEQGLAGGIFYMPGYAQYQDVTAADAERTLGPWEVMTWILTNFASVDEVRSALPQIRVAAIAAPGLNIVAPVHFIVHDASGQSLVIEYLKGQLNLHDNRVGVITNSPEFSWHLTNLNNYASLSPLNAEPIKLDGLPIEPLGQGSGMYGLPGDYTPASRFVRATALGHAALPGENGQQAVEQLFHVLDAFDIPLGTVEEVVDGKKIYEFTSWTTANDLTSRTFYFHTHDNRRVRRIALMQADLNADHIVTFRSYKSGQDYDDLQSPARN